MTAPLLLINSLVRYEAVLRSCGTSLESVCVCGGGGPTCDSAHTWWLNSAASLEHQATSTMTCYPTQSYYPETANKSLPYPNNAERPARKRQVSILKSLVWLNQALDSNPRSSDSSISQNGRLLIIHHSGLSWGVRWLRCDRQSPAIVSRAKCVWNPAEWPLRWAG